MIWIRRAKLIDVFIEKTVVPPKNRSHRTRIYYYVYVKFSERRPLMSYGIGKASVGAFFHVLFTKRIIPDNDNFSPISLNLRENTLLEEFRPVMSERLLKKVAKFLNSKPIYMWMAEGLNQITSLLRVKINSSQN